MKTRKNNILNKNNHYASEFWSYVVNFSKIHTCILVLEICVVGSIYPKAHDARSLNTV